MADNRYLSDARWRQLFDEMRVAVRELTDLDARVIDPGASEEDWTKAWGEYSGLVSRLGHLQQQLLRRRMELLDLSR